MKKSFDQYFFNTVKGTFLSQTSPLPKSDHVRRFSTISADVELCSAYTGVTALMGTADRQKGELLLFEPVVLF